MLMSHGKQTYSIFKVSSIQLNIQILAY